MVPSGPLGTFKKSSAGFADQKDFNSHEGDTVQKTNQYFDHFTTGACDDD